MHDLNGCINNRSWIIVDCHILMAEIGNDRPSVRLLYVEEAKLVIVIYINILFLLSAGIVEYIFWDIISSERQLEPGVIHERMWRFLDYGAFPTSRDLIKMTWTRLALTVWVSAGDGEARKLPVRIVETGSSLMFFCLFWYMRRSLWRETPVRETGAVCIVEE